MKKVKKILVFLLSCHLLICLWACSNGQEGIYSDALPIHDDKAPSKAENHNADEAAHNGTLRISVFDYSDNDNYTEDIGILAKQYMEQNPNVEIIFDAYYSPIDFNDVETYTIQEEAYLQKLRVSLMAGDAGDIVDVSALYADNLSDSGIFHDLNTFFSEDGRVQRNDLFENVLNLTERDGKLCYLTTGFSIPYVKLNTRVTDGLGVNIDEYEALAPEELLEWYAQWKETGDAANPFYFVEPDMGKNALLPEVIADFMQDVDSVSFNSPEFIRYLKLSNKIQTSLSSRHSTYVTWTMNAFESMNRSFIISSTLKTVNAFDDLNLYLDSSTYSTKGLLLTTSTGKRPVSPLRLYAIPSSSEQSGLAWDFLTFCISSDQSFNGPDRTFLHKWDFSINRDNFKEDVQALLNDPSQYDTILQIADDVEVLINEGNIVDLGIYPILEQYYDQDLISAEECARQIQERVEIIMKE